MKFNYFKKDGEYRDVDGGWDGDSGYDFDYKPDPEKFSKVLVELVTNYYFEDVTKKHPELHNEIEEIVEQIICENDLEDKIAKNFKDMLKERFEDEAQSNEN